VWPGILEASPDCNKNIKNATMQWKGAGKWKTGEDSEKQGQAIS